MAPLDWDKFMSLDLNELDEPSAADDMYDVLAEFTPGDESDSARLKKLFEIAQILMLMKGAHAQLVEEELANAAASEGKAAANRDQELETTIQELEKLRRENKDLKRYGGEGGGGVSGDTRFLRDNLNQLENDVASLNRELKERDRTFREEKENSDRYYQRAMDAEGQLRDLRKENERMQDDIRDYQRQLESQREAMITKRDEDSGQLDRISQKTRQLVSALDENRNLAENNMLLEDKIKEMKEEMRDGEREIERTMNEYLKLKQIVDHSDKTMDGIRRENEMLKDQVADLMDQVRSKADADDEIMTQVNNKVEEWKSILADKDDRIYDLQDQLLKMRDQLIASNMDTEKTSVAMLTKAVEDRDKQIEDLRKKLDEATSALDENAALIDDVRQDLGKTGKGHGDLQQQRMVTLQSTLKLHESQLKDAETRAGEAEQDAQAKDKQLSDALERMRQYEAGEYGLPEAVGEIKDLKAQINVRDRQIEELTQYINRCEMQINELYDESDDLRGRLGLDPKEPLDLTQYRKKKGIRMQEERALNRVLQKEVEQLEEERIEMKQQIRKLAQSTGTRAVALGLTNDDMDEVNQLIDELKEKRLVSATANKIKSSVEKDDLKIRNIQLDQDLEKNSKKVERLGQENAELKAKNSELIDENSNLEKGMKEINEAIKEQSGMGGDADANVLQCPTLERMLAAIDAKNVLGRYDSTLYLKAQVDNLTGHNEELRKELREARFEATKSTVNLEKTTTKLETVQVELKALREAGAGGFFQSMPLPEGMAITSSDVIASLNEHLVQILQELSLKEDMVARMESAMENYRRKFAVVRHQQSLLYQEYMEGRKEWEESMTKMKRTLDETLGKQEEDVVRIQEFDRLTDTLAQDEVEVRRRLADMTRKITVLRVNEKALTRRYNAMQDVEGALRKEVTKLRSDMVAMETAVQERLGYLQRHKDMSSFRVAALQKALDDSVPSAELDSANKKFTELTEKYRDMLDKQNMLVVKTDESSGYEIEVKRLHDERNMLTQEMAIDKEKLHTLEAAFEEMKKKGLASSQYLRDNDLTSISKKLTTLELKELNERQRAEHASHMYDRQKEQLRHLEDRNFELERKFAELTRMNLEQQKVERDLRDDLANCVTKAISDADRRKITQLEECEISLKLEVSKLKEISEVATMQVMAFESQQQSRDKEVTSLRQQLVDFQAQSDPKAVIGKLHRQIVQLQVSEGMAVRKLEEAMKKMVRLEAEVLRTEQRVDDKDQTIYHNRLEARSKTKHLKHTIQDLRRNYAGSVPLRTQERFAQNMAKLQDDKTKIESDLIKNNAERLEIEDKLCEVRLQHKGLQELIATLQDGRGAEKVAEWHHKMEAVRLEDLRYKREIERLKQQVKFQESIIKKHESEVLVLEEDKVRQSREFEERELEWEQREVELERIIANMERQQAEIAGAASQFEVAVSAMPDPNWPVSKQLDHAVTTIKKHVKMVLDAKAEVEHHKKRVDEMTKEVREKEREVLSRDRIITDLKLRLPASAERDEAILKVTSKFSTSKPPQEEDYEARQAVRIAQSTISSLQARVQQKEETLQKYQALLRQAREDMQTMNGRHEEEMRLMHNKLHAKSDSAFQKLKQTLQDSLNRTQSAVPTNEQLKKLNELEDIVTDQDNSLAALRDKLTRSRQDVQAWTNKYDDLVRQIAAEKEILLQDHGEDVRAQQEALAKARRQLEDRKRELSVVQEELESQREANARAPTTTMKDMMERLKNQLALKEKQHQALSKALMELRGDMVQQAQQDVKANADQSQMEHNIQRVVMKSTKEYQDRIEELEAHNQRLKREAKKRKDKENVLSADLEETKQDLAKRETQVRKLKEDRGRLEADVEELERKVERMGTMQKQRGVSGGVEHQLEELRRQNKLMAEELKRTGQPAEKPYEQQGKDHGTSDQMVARWEESKKWQKMVERLKARLKEREADIDRITRNSELVKNALDRANKEKESLEYKLRNATRAAMDAPIAKATAPLVSATPSRPMTHDMADLKRQNHELEDEVARLKRQLTLGKDAAFEEVQLRNKFLSEQLEQLTQGMSQRMSASQEATVSLNAFRELQDKEHVLQKQVIKLSEENLGLRFEVEQAKKDIPRLKERIGDLQKYVEILKVEKEQLQQLNGSSRSLGSLSTASSNIRRIGDSGKSVRELEKTVALLKKVIERCQAENEQLKKAPGVVSADQLQTLQRENQGLKEHVEEVRQKMGAGLSERYQTQQKGTIKMMADYDQLGRDLMKEKETNEKLRIRLRQEELSRERLEADLAQCRDRLQTEAGQSLGARDSKAWRSTVASRMSEERVKAMDDDLRKKNNMLGDVKILLREAAEREQHLLQDKARLEEQVAVLEAFPGGSEGNDPDVVRQYQLARLTIDRLEKEKTELLNELQLLRGRSGREGQTPADTDGDDIVATLRDNHRLMTDNVDLSTQVKTLTLEKHRLQQEIELLKKELSNFGPEFFEEVEDLKFNHQEAVQRNVEYEEQLRQLSRQFGVSVNIPDE